MPSHAPVVLLSIRPDLWMSTARFRIPRSEPTIDASDGIRTCRRPLAAGTGSAMMALVLGAFPSIPTSLASTSEPAPQECVFCLTKPRDAA
jgi:hypothetical protein